MKRSRSLTEIVRGLLARKKIEFDMDHELSSHIDAQILSYTVSQRRQEMGIRLAIGSPVSGIFKLILSQGMRLALIGVLMGLSISLAMGRMLGSLLYEISATDPATFAINALILTAIALLACWIPCPPRLPHRPHDRPPRRIKSPNYLSLTAPKAGVSS